MRQTELTNAQIAVRNSRNTIIGNVLLTAFKLFAGITAHSQAMISDAVESLSDIFSTAIVIVGVKLAARKSDKEHPYGHDRFECVAAILLSAVLFAVGLGIGWAGLKTILFGREGLEAPGLLALIAAAVTILVKELMYHYTKAAAKKTGSASLMADAWHHRSDGLSSIAGFAGILGARLGFPVLDSVASVLICGFIFFAAFNIFRGAVGQMTDRACDEETEAALRELAAAQDGVHGVDSLRTRVFADKMYVDLEISMDGQVTLFAAHAVAEAVHDSLEAAFPKLKHCMVHVNPVLDAGMDWS